MRVGHRALVAADPDCGAATRGAPLVDDVADVVGVGPVPTAQVLDWMGQGAFVAVVVTTDDDPTRVHTVLHLGTRSPIVDRLWSDRRPSARIGPDRDTRARHVKVLVRITDADLHTPELEPVAAAVAVRGTDVTDLVHRGRRPNAAQRSALQWRSPECTVVGCPNLIRLEVDHVVEWRITHHTTLDELDHLCRHHHRMKTHDGHRLEPGTGKRRLLPPPDP